MIIIRNDSGDIDVLEPHDFKRFSFQLPEGDALQDSAPVTFENDTYAWISEAALRSWPGAADVPDWQEKLSGMIAFAQTKGWVSSSGRIRAHIERA